MPGVFPSQAISALIQGGHLSSPAPLTPGQIQPASFDLTLSSEIYSLPGSLLPLPGETVRELVQRFARSAFDLRRPEILVRGQVYVVRLREKLSLPPTVSAYANNKSSTGRIDLKTRLLTDHNPRYDKVPAGYQGELWLEIMPKSFDVVLREGDSLNQTIFYQGRDFVSLEALEALAQTHPILWDPAGRGLPLGPQVSAGGAPDALLMTLDLDQEIVGYVAKKSYRPVNLAQVGAHDPREFFEPIRRPPDGTLFLSQEAFYIFSTYEYVSIPPDYAVEMLPYDTSAGEFRAHYAGFFDPGFGWGLEGELRGTPAVLEVRPYEDDLIVRHRQPVCKMAFERLSERPDQLYGAGTAGSHYAEQRGPRLSKFFRGP